VLASGRRRDATQAGSQARGVQGDHAGVTVLHFRRLWNSRPSKCRNLNYTYVRRYVDIKM
jgi:hypothetical protein